jgi:predicted dehydrogenase
LRLALIGLGHRALAKALPALRPLNLSIVAGVDPQLPSKFNHEQLSNTTIFKSVADLAMMNSNQRPDVAFVALPHSEYPIAVSQLLQHGIDVIQEKPLAISVREGLARVALAEQNGVRLGVAAQRRFSKRYSQLLEWLPMVGAVRAVHVVEKIKVLDLDDGWRASKAKAGGGVIIDLGYHMIDQLVSLFGPDCVVNHANQSISF